MRYIQPTRASRFGGQASEVGKKSPTYPVMAVVEAKGPLKWTSDIVLNHWPAGKKRTSGHEDQPQLLHPGKTNKTNILQVQLHMYLCKTSHADFIPWTLRQTVIFGVQRDEDFICKADVICNFRRCIVIIWKIQKQ